MKRNKDISLKHGGTDEEIKTRMPCTISESSTWK